MQSCLVLSILREATGSGDLDPIGLFNYHNHPLPGSSGNLEVKTLLAAASLTWKDQVWL